VKNISPFVWFVGMVYTLNCRFPPLTIILMAIISVEVTYSALWMLLLHKQMLLSCLGGWRSQMWAWIIYWALSEQQWCKYLDISESGLNFGDACYHILFYSIPHWHVLNATIPCHSQELLPFLPVICRISWPIRCIMIFSLEILEKKRKNNDGCILSLVIYRKETGLLHTKVSNHNIIYSSETEKIVVTATKIIFMVVFTRYVTFFI
jgi:hypothetical protein